MIYLILCGTAILYCLLNCSSSQYWKVPSVLVKLGMYVCILVHFTYSLNLNYLRQEAKLALVVPLEFCALLISVLYSVLYSASRQGHSHLLYYTAFCIIPCFLGLDSIPLYFVSMTLCFICVGVSSAQFKISAGSFSTS